LPTRHEQHLKVIEIPFSLISILFYFLKGHCRVCLNFLFIYFHLLPSNCHNKMQIKFQTTTSQCVLTWNLTTWRDSNPWSSVRDTTDAIIAPRARVCWNLRCQIKPKIPILVKYRNVLQRKMLVNFTALYCLFYILPFRTCHGRLVDFVAIGMLYPKNMASLAEMHFLILLPTNQLDNATLRFFAVRVLLCLRSLLYEKNWQRKNLRKIKALLVSILQWRDVCTCALLFLFGSSFSQDFFSRKKFCKSRKRSYYCICVN
jgi:hypothetical protein